MVADITYMSIQHLHHRGTKNVSKRSLNIQETLQQESVVADYFANMNMPQGSPLSSDLQISYNNAKNSVNNILGMFSYA